MKKKKQVPQRYALGKHWTHSFSGGFCQYDTERQDHSQGCWRANGNPLGVLWINSEARKKAKHQPSGPDRHSQIKILTMMKRKPQMKILAWQQMTSSFLAKGWDSSRKTVWLRGEGRGRDTYFGSLHIQTPQYLSKFLFSPADGFKAVDPFVLDAKYKSGVFL